jgi:hypothetical protein
MSAAVVNKNETLIRLTNPDIEIRVAQLASEVRQEQMRVTNLNLLLSDDPTVAPLIPAADKALQDARERWRQAQNDLESLNIKAPRAGNVLPPPHAAHPPDDSKGLNGWLGTPLDTANRGCFLDIGTVVCQIGDPQSVEAMLIIEQSSIPFVKVGQQVRLRIHQGPVQVVDGEVSELAKADVSEIPSPLVNALDLPVRREGKKGARTAATYYQARVKLKPTDAPLAIGMLGEAKVLSNWQPLGMQLLRWLQLTFWV